MTEQRCKELIASDISVVALKCKCLLDEIEDIELNDVNDAIVKIQRYTESAKQRLRACDDY